MTPATLLLVWVFPFWLLGQDCPDWSLGYTSRDACNAAREVMELRGYETELCDLLPRQVETRLAH